MNRRDMITTMAAAGAGLLVHPSESETFLSGDSTASAAKFPVKPAIETRGGAVLFVRDWGAGKNVLFVHSWAVNSDLWQNQMLFLSEKGFRCVAYDKRGHGRSSDRGMGYDPDTLADDLADVIRQLDLREITLVGHSMGCGEIVRYLSRHGNSRVARLVFVSPTTPFGLKTPDNPDGVDKAAVEHSRAVWSSDFPRWLADNARPFFTAETSPEMVQWAIRMCLQSSLKALVECSRTDIETDYRKELPKITVPTLIVHGDADVSAAIDRTGRRTAQLIPGSQLKVYEGAPHGLMFTHADKLNGDLLRFLNT